MISLHKNNVDTRLHSVGAGHGGRAALAVLVASLLVGQAVARSGQDTDWLPSLDALESSGTLVVALPYDREPPEWSASNGSISLARFATLYGRQVTVHEGATLLSPVAPDPLTTRTGSGMVARLLQTSPAQVVQMIGAQVGLEQVPAHLMPTYADGLTAFPGLAASFLAGKPIRAGVALTFEMQFPTSDGRQERIGLLTVADYRPPEEPPAPSGVRPHRPGTITTLRSLLIQAGQQGDWAWAVDERLRDQPLYVRGELSLGALHSIIQVLADPGRAVRFSKPPDLPRYMGQVIASFDRTSRGEQTASRLGVRRIQDWFQGNPSTFSDALAAFPDLQARHRANPLKISPEAKGVRAVALSFYSVAAGTTVMPGAFRHGPDGTKTPVRVPQRDTLGFGAVVPDFRAVVP